MPPGLASALGAFVIWGLFPLYIQFIAQVPAVEVVLHRSVWSLLLVLGILAVQRRWTWLSESLRQPRRLLLFTLSALLLWANWIVYVYAAQTGRVVEASLGYFINPLVSVMLGVLVLRERPGAVQWTAVALAAAGVAWLTVVAGRLPWIALTLAATFGLYGLLRKTASLGALEGLALESLLLAPVVVPALAWWTVAHDGVLRAGPASTLGWLLLSGPLTAAPLLFFANAARQMPLASLGLIQYLSPTLQFLLGVWVFHEPFDSRRLLGFVLIWSGLALVSMHALRSLRNRQ
ncbi:MAG: EamA family transporter RarD [Rubrivivax sp.]|nr:EamA family transporter RarD [Rubrivivax sp.]